MNLLALAALVALGFAVETATGFGSTVVVLTFGALLFPLGFLTAVVVPVNLGLSAAILVRDGAAADLRFLALRVLPAMLAGMAAGVALAGVAPGRSLQLAYACFVVVLAAFELLRQLRPRDSAAPTALSRPASLGWLAAGGVAHGAFAASGPLVVFVVSRTLADKRAFRATLAALWLSLNAVLAATYALRGALTRESGLTSLEMLAPAALGMLGGELLHRRLDPARFRATVFGTMLAGGLTLALSAW